MSFYCDADDVQHAIDEENDVAAFDDEWPWSEEIVRRPWLYDGAADDVPVRCDSDWDGLPRSEWDEDER